MSGVSGDRRPRNIPNDGFELLREDVERMIDDEMKDCGNSFIDMDAERYNVPASMLNGGIIQGLTPSTIVADDRHIVVAAGIAYDKNAIRFDHAQKTLDVLNNGDYEGGVTATSGYIVAKIQVLDDPATLGTHPFSGNQQAKRKLVQCDIMLTTTAPTGLKWVNDKRIYLGSWFLDGGAGGTLKLFDRCVEVYASGLDSLNLYPYDTTGGLTPTAAEVRGVPGTKYWVRMKKEVGSSVVIAEGAGFSGLNSFYIDITIPTDAGGTIVATFQDVMNAINTATHFRADLGAGTTPTNIFGGPTYSDEYKALQGGREYRQYAQAKIGTWSMYHSTPNRFDPSDPYTRHLMMKGHGPQTENNPHGTGIGDIDGLVDEMQGHQRREHNRQRSGISKGSNSDWLEASLPAPNDLRISTQNLDANNRAIVNGIATNTGGASVVFTQAAVPSFAPFTSEFVLSSSGALSRRDVAVWQTGAANIAPTGFPNESLFSIVDKHPDLNGTYPLDLSVDAFGVYTMAFGGALAGPSVDVTVSGTTYTLYLKNGQWIKVYHEGYGAPLPPSTIYQNSIVFLKSEQNDTTLTVAMAAFRNGAAPALWDHIKDCRVYGTLSVEHDAYGQVGDALSFGCRYDGPTLLAYAGILPISSLRPFEVDYRGRTYRFDATSLGSIGGVPLDTTGNYNFLAVRFDNANNPSIINLGMTIAGALVPRTDVLLGCLIYSGGNPDSTLSIFFKRASTMGYVVTTLKVGTEWNIDEALRYITACCLDAYLKANVTFVLDLMTDVASTVPTAVAGKLVINGNDHTMSGNTAITVDDIVAKDVVFSNDFRFIQNGATSNCSMSRMKTGGTYASPLVAVSAASSIVEMERSIFYHANPTGGGTIEITAGVCGVKLTDCMWLGTGALNHLIKTSTVAPTDLVNIKVDGLVAISSGTLFQFNGISNTFEFSRGDWAHQDAPGAGASPIVCAGNGGVYVLNFRESRLSWRLVNAGWQDMISIADTTAGDIDFSCSFDDNEMYLAYESTTVRPTLIHLPALGGATSFKGRGLHFSGNSYHVAADGATSYANAWRVIWNQILSAYQSSGAIYDSSYEAIDEKIFLVGNTLSASHAEGVACAESAYVVRGLTFECFRPTTARELRVSALTVGGTANYGVEIRGVVFPHIVHSGGVVSSKHQIAVAAKKSIMISDIENAAMDGDYAIACLISDDDCRVDVRGANGRVSGVGCLAKIDDLGNNDANVMVSGLHATDTADANGLTAVMIASGTGGKSFCVGCCQHGGNPAVSSGFDISNNYYLP